jgi:hypothetical protein
MISRTYLLGKSCSDVRKGLEREQQVVEGTNRIVGGRKMRVANAHFLERTLEGTTPHLERVSNSGKLPVTHRCDYGRISIATDPPTPTQARAEECRQECVAPLSTTPNSGWQRPLCCLFPYLHYVPTSSCSPSRPKTQANVRQIAVDSQLF